MCQGRYINGNKSLVYPDTELKCRYVELLERVGYCRKEKKSKWKIVLDLWQWDLQRLWTNIYCKGQIDVRDRERWERERDPTGIWQCVTEAKIECEKGK